MANFIDLERHGKIALLKFNRPEALNAIGSISDCDDIVAALDGLAQDGDVSVIVITGSGRAFCSGGDLKAIKERRGIGALDQPASTRDNYRRGVQRVTRALNSIEVPTVAAINGAAVGLGLDLACLCDIRLVSAEARMAASFIKVGIVPGDGGAWVLSKTVGHAKAAELFFTGAPFGADEALEMGLVSRVVPGDKLLDEALSLAEQIAANPARALRMTKRLLIQARHQSYSDVLELSAAFQAIVHETQDHVEAVDALLEKRAPVFTGD